MITLPIPPSVNHLYGRRGHFTYITAIGKAWFEEAGWIVKSKWKKEMMTGDVAVYIKLYTARRYDYDNCLKATNDLLTKMRVIEDDSQIIFAQIEKVKVDHLKDQKLTIEIE
jgi:crossover junction endodeoxyribonuclease RusA